MDFSKLTARELLRTHAEILDELRRREIVRSANNPASDLAELLFCRAFQWTRRNKSAEGHDALDANNVRYEIKGRRLTRDRISRQLSAIRNLPNNPFDHLAGVLFDRDFTVLRAAIVPLAVVKDHATHSEHTNSWRFLLRDEIWTIPGVQDVTLPIQACASTL